MTNHTKSPAARHLLQTLIAAIAAVVILSLADGIAGRFLFSSINKFQMTNWKIEREAKFWDVEATTNSDGFRGREFKRRKSSGTKRILFVGDSMTFGSHVEWEASYPYILEERLNERDSNNQWEVYNLALPGMTPFSYDDLVEGVAVEFEADWIVVCYYQGSDRDFEDWSSDEKFYLRPRWSENLRNLELANLRRFLDSRRELVEFGKREPEPIDTQWLETALNSEDRITRARAERVDPSLVEELRRLGFHENILPERAIRRPDILHTRMQYEMNAVTKPYAWQTFNAIFDNARPMSAQPVLLMLPSWETTDVRTWATLERMGYYLRDLLQYDRRFSDTHQHFARRLGIPAIDMQPILRRSEKPCFLKFDPHLNGHGHEVVAEALTDWFLNKGNPADTTRVSQGEFNSVSKYFARYRHFEKWSPYPETSVTDTRGRYQLPNPPDRLRVVNSSITIQTPSINRIRIRMSATNGDYGLIRWARNNHSDNEEVRREFDRKYAYFPIVADGEMHEYEIAVSHLSLKWEDQARVIEIMPAIPHFPSEGDLGEVRIEWIDFGRRPETKVHPNVWGSVEEILNLN